uniref:Uncharacterized protein n=1 Tax=Aegilops tauschii TaxID=37682 RepID=M8C447_AEGTA
MAGRAPTPATSCRGEVEYRSSSWRRCQHRLFAHSLLVYVVSEKVISCAWSLWVLYLLFIVLSFASLPAQSNTISSPVLRLAVKQITIKEKEVDTLWNLTLSLLVLIDPSTQRNKRFYGPDTIAKSTKKVMFLFGYSTLKNMSIQWRWRHLPEKRGGYPSKGRCDGGGRHPRPNHRSKAAILFHSINRRSPESVDDRDPQTTVLYVANLSHKFGFPRHTSSVYSQF